MNDDGVGFTPSDRAPALGAAGGFGLFSAEAQVRALGGRLHLESAPGTGTRVTVSVPVTEDPPESHSP